MTTATGDEDYFWDSATAENGFQNKLWPVLVKLESFSKRQFASRWSKFILSQRFKNFVY